MPRHPGRFQRTRSHRGAGSSRVPPHVEGDDGAQRLLERIVDRIRILLESENRQGRRQLRRTGRREDHRPSSGAGRLPATLPAPRTALLARLEAPEHRRPAGGVPDETTRLHGAGVRQRRRHAALRPAVRLRRRIAFAPLVRPSVLRAALRALARPGAPRRQTRERSADGRRSRVRENRRFRICLPVGAQPPVGNLLRVEVVRGARNSRRSALRPEEGGRLGRRRRPLHIRHRSDAVQRDSRGAESAEGTTRVGVEFRGRLADSGVGGLP